MSTKKAFVELVKFLETNKNKKVSSILDEVYLMTQSKQSQQNSYYDEDNKLIAIFCYYHKRFESVDTHVYGPKKSTKTGLNSMCRIGVNAWTRQQAEAKKASSSLLAKVSSGEVKPEDILTIQAEIEANKHRIEFSEDYPESFETLDELLASK